MWKWLEGVIWIGWCCLIDYITFLGLDYIYARRALHRARNELSRQIIWRRLCLLSGVISIVLYIHHTPLMLWLLIILTLLMSCFNPASLTTYVSQVAITIHRLFHPQETQLAPIRSSAPVRGAPIGMAPVGISPVRHNGVSPMYSPNYSLIHTPTPIAGSTPMSQLIRRPLNEYSSGYDSREFRKTETSSVHSMEYSPS